MPRAFPRNTLQFFQIAPLTLVSACVAARAIFTLLINESSRRVAEIRLILNAERSENEKKKNQKRVFANGNIGFPAWSPQIAGEIFSKLST